MPLEKGHTSKSSLSGSHIHAEISRFQPSEKRQNGNAAFVEVTASLCFTHFLPLDEVGFGAKASICKKFNSKSILNDEG